MSRYLSEQQLQATLGRSGVEHFLGFFDSNQGAALRYVVMARTSAGEVKIDLYEALDVRTGDWVDIYGFQGVSCAAGEPSAALVLVSVAEAVIYLRAEFGGTAGRVVNRGVADSEFEDLRRGQTRVDR